MQTERTDRLRIAFFTESFRENVGGLTRAVIQMHDHLVARGHNVRVFTLPQRGGPTHPGDLMFVPAFTLPGVGALAPDSRIAYSYPFVLRELARWNPDVVHLHTPFPTSWLGMWAAHRLSLPVVATYHANVTGWTEAYARWLLRGRTTGLLGLVARAEVAFYSRAHLVTAPSRSAAAKLLDQELRTPVVVLSNGVDVQRFTPAWQAPPDLSVNRDRWDRPPTALYVGRLSAEKGMAELVVAIRHLLSFHPVASFRVVGDGPWRGHLLHELGPFLQAGRLHLVGYVAWEHMPEVYRDADVLVFPSAVETQGLAVLEAMASGLPVVGVRGGAVPELVEDGKNGFLVSPGDGRALAEAALRLLENQDLRWTMAALARETAVRHSVNASIALLERLYESVIDARASVETTCHTRGRRPKSTGEVNKSLEAQLSVARKEAKTAVDAALAYLMCDPAICEKAPTYWQTIPMPPSWFTPTAS
ncbi:MAG: glycosyltransferase [Limnochordales bacterium]|nr:glycosyltransferase [Limnochordales bacterium]